MKKFFKLVPLLVPVLPVPPQGVAKERTYKAAFEKAMSEEVIRYFGQKRDCTSPMTKDCRAGRTTYTAQSRKTSYDVEETNRPSVSS